MFSAFNSFALCTMFALTLAVYEFIFLPVWCVHYHYSHYHLGNGWFA